jgi:hypothetical protein
MVAWGLRHESGSTTDADACRCSKHQPQQSVISEERRERDHCGGVRNPEFGYYFLRLSSERLLQNVARLKAIIERHKLQTEMAKTDARSKSPPIRTLD